MARIMRPSRRRRGRCAPRARRRACAAASAPSWRHAVVDARNELSVRQPHAQAAARVDVHRLPLPSQRREALSLEFLQRVEQRARQAVRSRGCGPASPATRRAGRAARSSSGTRRQLIPTPITATPLARVSTRMPPSLRLAHDQVVGPLERDLRAERAQRARDGDAGDERERGELARRPRERRGERERDPGAARAMPAPAALAAPGGLLLRGEQNRMGDLFLR